jgi:hypothetical protein
MYLHHFGTKLDFLWRDVPKHVYDNVKLKSRWRKIDFKPKSALIFVKDICGYQFTITFKDNCC